MELELPEGKYIGTPYSAKILKRRGVKVDLKLVEDFFIPSEEDLKTIKIYLEGIETILDVGSGYGNLTNQIAKQRPEARVIGIDTMYWDKKFKRPTPAPNVKFEFNGIEAMAYANLRGKEIETFDCVICSWMPHGADWREMISILSRKMIILILSSQFATGTSETYTGMGEFGFMFERCWKSKDSIIQIWRRI